MNLQRLLSMNVASGIIDWAALMRMKLEEDHEKLGRKNVKQMDYLHRGAVIMHPILIRVHALWPIDAD
ncbi:MAG: hypothetical protein K8R91_05800 [Phycisphaerae bacterium]|nr:hypothetical protein [Phycisphaerae bacterium]